MHGQDQLVDPKWITFVFGVLVAVVATFISSVFTMSYGLWAEPHGMGAIALPVLLLAELLKVMIPFWAYSLHEAKLRRHAARVGALWLAPAAVCALAYAAFASQAPASSFNFGVSFEQRPSIERMEDELSRLGETRPLSQIQRDLARAEFGEDLERLQAERRDAERVVELKKELVALRWIKDHPQTPAVDGKLSVQDQTNLVVILIGVETIGAIALLGVAWARPRTIIPGPPPAPAISAPRTPEAPPSQPGPQFSAMGESNLSSLGAMGFMPQAPHIIRPKEPEVIIPRKMAPPPDRYGFRRAADITPTPRTWFWPDVLRAGRLAMLAGEGGVGKSTIAAFIAAASGRQGKWPTGEDISPGGVIFCETEDDPDEDTTPRLLAAGADLNRIELTNKRFDLANDITGIRMAADRLKRDAGVPARLLVLSPIKTFFGNKESYNDAEVRNRLEKLLRYAEGTGICVLGIGHLTKDKRSMGGSQAWVNVARCGLKAEWTDGVGGPRHVIPLKANSGSVGWSIPFDTMGVTIDGCPSEVVTWGEKTYAEYASRFRRDDAEDVGSEDYDEAPQAPQSRGREDAGRAKARAFVARVMAQGMRMGNEIAEAADAEGIARTTLDRAAEDLGIVKTPSGRTAEWGWAS